MTIQIDPEFQSHIPALREDERAGLEASLIAEGCRDPLVTWNGLLLDGHNRFEICERNGIEYQTVQLKLSDRPAALAWIEDNQLNRRNLTADQVRYYRGRQYNREKKARTDNLVQNQPKDQIDTSVVSTADRLATEHGVGSATIKRDGKFAEEVESTPELHEAVMTGTPVQQVKRELKEQQREARREENRERIAKAPDPIASRAKFSTIVIDPPWDWGDEGDQDQLGRARPTYGTMPLSELLELPVDALADTDCHLYLWITNRSLPKGFQLLEQWGFRYITAITWCKPRFGMGNYFRGSTEHLLFGVKGSQPLRRKDVGTWFSAPRGPGGHSSKPEEAYSLIESCSPGPYLDMFARQHRDGWTAWGAEADAA